MSFAGTLIFTETYLRLISSINKYLTIKKPFKTLITKGLMKVFFPIISLFPSNIKEPISRYSGMDVIALIVVNYNEYPMGGTGKTERLETIGDARALTYI